ncbi:MAG: hypothetical protein U9R36_02180 [Elusimicrobiota bacterium]|nr:hypothetical protein [Elusimicrobiota bacterium]
MFLIFFLAEPAFAGLTAPYLGNTLILKTEAGILYQNYSYGTSFYKYNEDLDFEGYGFKTVFKPGVVMNYFVDMAAGRGEVAGRKTSRAGMIEAQAGIEGVLAGDIEIFPVWKWALAAGGRAANFNSYQNNTIDIDYREGFIDLSVYIAKKYSNFIPYIGAAFKYSVDKYEENLTGASSKSDYSDIAVTYGLKYIVMSNFYVQAGGRYINESGFYLDVGGIY